MEETVTEIAMNPAEISNETLYGFATMLGAHSYGGIVISGMNGGVESGDTQVYTPACETKFTPWKERFSSMSYSKVKGRDVHDVYERNLLRWFAIWFDTYGQDGGTLHIPDTLDRALCQTNLYIDKSKNFKDIVRDKEAKKQNIRRFSDSIRALNPSAIVLTSRPVYVDAVLFAQQEMPDEQTIFHDIRAADLKQLKTYAEPERPRARFDVILCMAGSIPTLITDHPQRHGITNATLQAAKTDMRAFLESALSVYATRQAGRLV